MTMQVPVLRMDGIGESIPGYSFLDCSTHPWGTGRVEDNGFGPPAKTVQHPATENHTVDPSQTSPTITADNAKIVPVATP